MGALTGRLLQKWPCIAAGSLLLTCVQQCLETELRTKISWWQQHRQPLFRNSFLADVLKIMTLSGGITTQRRKVLWKWREQLSKINWVALCNPQLQVSEEAPASYVRNQRCRSDTTNWTCCFYPRAAEPVTSSVTGQTGHYTPLSCPHNPRCRLCTPWTDASLERATAGFNTLVWLSERACARGNHRGGANDTLGHLPAYLKEGLLKETSGSLIRV